LSAGEIRENKLVNFWNPYIQSVRPLAVEAGQAATITLKGFNLTAPDTRYDAYHFHRDIALRITDFMETTRAAESGLE
jgi:hypothetical protein